MQVSKITSLLQEIFGGIYLDLFPLLEIEANFQLPNIIIV